MLRREQGRNAEARAHFQKGVEAFKKWEFTTFPLDHIETLLNLAEICSMEGELEHAHKMADWAKRLATQLQSDAGLAMAFQAEASALFAGGEKAAALEAYGKCLTFWEKAGWPHYKGKGLLAYSKAIAEINPEESNKLLSQAAEIFKKLGAKRDLEKVDAAATSIRSH
jgi:tetratricopeptide (TPR) repeat protein